MFCETTAEFGRPQRSASLASIRLRIKLANHLYIFFRRHYIYEAKAEAECGRSFSHQEANVFLIKIRNSGVFMVLKIANVASLKQLQLVNSISKCHDIVSDVIRRETCSVIC